MEDVLKIVDTMVPEQVIDVPKITTQRRHPAARCAPRAADGRTAGGRARALFRRTSSLFRWVKRRRRRGRRRKSTQKWSQSLASVMLMAPRGAGLSVRRGPLVDDRHIHCPVDPPGWDHRQARGGTEILAIVVALVFDVPVTVQRQFPAFWSSSCLRFTSSTEWWTFQ